MESEPRKEGHGEDGVLLPFLTSAPLSFSTQFYLSYGSPPCLSPKGKTEYCICSFIKSLVFFLSLLRWIFIGKEKAEIGIQKKYITNGKVKASSKNHG